MNRSPLLRNRLFYLGWLLCSYLSPQFARAQFFPSEPVIAEKHLPHLVMLVQNPSTSYHVRSDALIDLANLYYNKPRKRYKDLDKAIAYARAAQKGHAARKENDTWQRAATIIALAAIDKSDFQQAETTLLELAGSRRLDLQLRLAYAYCDADNDFKEKDWLRALALADDAVESASQMHDTVREIQGRQIAALVHAKQQNPRAETELLEIVKRFKKAKSTFYQTTYMALSEYKFYLGDQFKSMYYSLEAIQAMKGSGDSAMAGDIYANHALICADNDEYGNGYNYIHLAIKHYGRLAGLHDLSDAKFLSNVEYILAKTDDYERDLAQMSVLIANTPPQNPSDEIYHNIIMGRIYRQMKNFNKSETYYLAASRISAKHKIPKLVLTKGLAELYIDMKQYAKAAPLLHRVLNYQQSLPNGDVLHAQLMAYLADSAKGDYYDALKHLSACSTLNDFELKRIREENGQKLREMFEAKQREDEIKIKDRDIRLLNQNVNMQRDRVQNARLTTFTSVAITVLVTIIAGLIFSKYNQNIKSSREIKEKNEIITSKNIALEHLISEKEWLLKEVNHRVKNNLHTIMCLLESQAAFLGNDALKALETSQNRIYAMSLIHQKLYQSDDMQTVDMQSYFTDFLNFLFELFSIGNRVTIVQKVESIKIQTALAIPLALIVNEGVTNALKYAFPRNLRGTISVSLHKEGNQMILEIEDDGIGWDESSYNHQSSLGIQLMRGLSEDLGARIVFENRGGTKVSLILKYEVNEQEKISNSMFG
ncbi:Two-component sensor histidine kinase, contains HisKA and HATPase domains [Dyadobacter soli]|uniref:histidine kinase n=1 Tax=Dyadobacter soli TaxID=659014 RepID=A0A1G7MHA2_9BACT|nr:sensor histidine kinase [Dyadobacter soli]SDF60530.1 Two-component sensor histidine kinase, contains HisKA and HATPase domains [Dyadobacter soli]